MKDFSTLRVLSSIRLCLGYTVVLMSFYIGFLRLTALIARMANRSWISFIRMLTGRISASRCFAQTGTDMKATKILRKPVF